jgi:hypothetical protein
MVWCRARSIMRLDSIPRMASRTISLGQVRSRNRLVCAMKDEHDLVLRCLSKQIILGSTTSFAS